MGLFYLLATNIISASMPSGAAVYAVAIYFGKLDIENEGGVAWYGGTAALVLTIAEVVWDDYSPLVALDHVHGGGAHAHYVFAHCHEGGHVGSFVEGVGHVALAEDIALGVFGSGDETTDVVDADAVAELWTIAACACGEFLDVYPVIGVRCFCLNGVDEVVGKHLGPSVATLVGKGGDGVYVVLIARFPVVILACLFTFAA